ncbi:uncharacterized protein Z520_06277 [Fonsecaea multimorphosa CBS 102226]|uniref:Uncharacterized protein n=1 Tax=Fonsecaea multimorphosa CBS 102226 TaxID=1442371 RepID=A0A0D2JXA5_9EURO|nr:uncharacterized protein Z520_06277 [Fonsecaea multimorphosa CBS 102226]KIX98197.1 hypothetical protein Z520_06277 [Fonsecaea multimorphosa CBS 102226]OAL22666.1 hypothetical protein AYO22_07225 [Fonsecaea multimorphosa]
MASEKPPSIVLPPLASSGRQISPSPQGLRQRPLGRASTFAEGNPPLNRRRSSFLSETFSETRKSLRSSTDDILLPRARNDDDLHDHDDNSHWQSLPLGLALLPAVGGMFFKNGSAVITDVTLLGLAAIFMNWALRSPWDWYRAAQTTVLADSTTPPVFTPIDEVDEDQIALSLNGRGEDDTSKAKSNGNASGTKLLNTESATAQKELRVHELLALLSCFVFPLIAAWLLHSIRSQLSRPSEGLVSDYNLTIFILVAEIRPISHLIKMVQRRTLFLQRRANIDVLKESSRMDNQQLRDISRRLDDLEAHIADRIASTGKQKVEQVDHALVSQASATATSEVKKTVQPELDALNRAMRRYEKRSTISSVQIEARLQDLETRLHDVVSLAAAAQRNADRIPNNYLLILANWICGAFVIPVQYLLYLSSLPSKALSSLVAVPKRYMTKKTRNQPAKDGRASRKGAPPRSLERERRAKVPP